MSKKQSHQEFDVVVIGSGMLHLLSQMIIVTANR